MAPVDQRTRRSVVPVKRLMFEQASEVPAKRRKTAARARPAGKAKAKGKVAKKDAKKAKTKKDPKEKKKAEGRKRKAPSDKAAGKKPKWVVQQHSSVKVLNVDPFFGAASLSKVPFVSTDNYSKLLITAVLTNNKAMINALIKDNKKVSTLFMSRSVSNSQNAFSVAIERDDVELLKTLIQIAKDDQTQRPPRTPRIMMQSSTGRYNCTSLGLARIRKIQTARGTKEGNNALLHREQCQHIRQIQMQHVSYVMQRGSMTMLRTLIGGEPDHRQFGKIYIAVRSGNLEVAEALMRVAIEDFQWGFGQLHFRVLSARKAEDLHNFRATSVTKKANSNNQITPLHCAAINPAESVLAKLLNVYPEYSMSDKNGWRPIHYAAACKGTGPLQLLLKKGVNPYEMNADGDIALHVAAMTGRAKNVEVLMKFAENKAAKAAKPKLKRTSSKRSMADDDEEEEDEADLSGQAKFGLGSINRGNRHSSTPLHLAVDKGHTEAVSMLLNWSKDIQIDLPLSVNKMKVSALMVACRQGHYEIAKKLLAAGANVQALDRLRRTPLIHAAMNGNAHICSFLLYNGADPNHKDSSGNTVLHYAAAYGWSFIVNMLLERGADPNAANDWKTSPLSIAFMNGHVGIVRILLDSKVDVNFVNDAGVTLIMMACQSDLHSSLVDQIKMLVTELHANCDVKDATDNTAMHHLAANAPTNPMYSDEKVVKVSKEIAQILLKAGPGPANEPNEAGFNALDLAVLNGNTPLIQLFISKGYVLTVPKDKEEKNMLHFFCVNYSNFYDVTDFFKVLMNSAPCLAALKEMAKLYDNKGMLPIHYVAYNYCDSLQRSSSWKNEKKHACQFLKILIEDLESDVCALSLKMEKDKKEKRRWRRCPDVDKDSLEENRRRFYSLRASVPKPTIGQQVNSKQSALMFLGLSNDGGHAFKMVKAHNPGAVRYKGRPLLHDAVRLNFPEVVKSLLSAGGDVNAVSEEKDNRQKGETALMVAVKMQDLSMVKLLLQKGANVGIKDGAIKNTALHYACCVPHRSVDSDEIVRLIVAKCSVAQLNSQNVQQRTPLHLAVNFNVPGTDASAELEEMLIAKGANPLIKDCRNRIPLHYAFCKIGDHENVSQIDPIELCHALATKQSVAVMDKFGCRPLHLASVRGALVCVQTLLQHGADINALEEGGNSPLTLAVRAQHLYCSMVLVQRMAGLLTEVKQKKKKEKEEEEDPVMQWKAKAAKKVEKKDSMSLFEAVLRHQWQGLAFILADRLPEEGVSHEALLHDCLRTRTYRLAMTLLRRWNDVGSRCGALFHTLVEHAQNKDAQASTQLRLAEMLRARKVPVTDKDRSGVTPISKAVTRNCFHLARFFVEECSVDPDAKDGLGRTAMIATFFTHKNDNLNEMRSWLYFLKDQGVSVNQLGPLPLHSPVWHISAEPPARCYTDPCGPVKISPLIDAIRHKQFHVVRMLLVEFQADPNLLDSSGQAPLSHAVQVNDHKIVRVLLDADYEGFEKDKSKNTKKPAQANIFSIFGSTQATKQNESDEDEDAEEDEDNADDDDDEEMDASSDDSSPKRKKYRHGNSSDECDSDAESQSDASLPVIQNDVGAGGEKKVNPVDKEIPEDLPTWEVTSKVNLTRVERPKQWSVLHHVVAPTPKGSFDNAHLFRLLVNAGVPLAHASELLSLAKDRKARVIAKTMQYLLKKDKKNWETMSEEPVGLHPDAKVPVLPGHVNVEIDYKGELVRFEESLKKEGKEKKQKYAVKVDDNCQVQSADVVLDERQPVTQYFDVLLHKVAVEHGMYGLYNFYKMQLVKQRVKDIYFLFTRWGRIGDTGQYQTTPFPDKESAMKEFEKVFRAKTANKWADIRDFQEKPKKYSLVPLDKMEVQPITEPVPVDFKTSKACTLSPDLLKLFKALFDVEAIRKHQVTSFGRCGNFPFGRLKREHLAKAVEIMKEIVMLSAEVRKGISSFHRGDPEEQAQKIREGSLKIAELSNAYFKLMPQGDYVFEAISPLLDESAVSEELDLLTRLHDLHLVGRLVLACQTRKDEIHPYDYLYAAIGTSLTPLREDSDEAQIILQLAGSDTQVERIFRVDRPGEEARCRSGLRRLLWHGTHPMHVPGILQSGLLKAPPGVERCGELFGKGVYFADSLRLASNYAHSITVNGKEKKFFFLCQVDLSEEGKNSDKEFRVVQGRVSPQPDGNYVMPNGCVVSLGSMGQHQGVTTWSTYHTQFVIFNEKRVRLQYLVLAHG